MTEPKNDLRHTRQRIAHDTGHMRFVVEFFSACLITLLVGGNADAAMISFSGTFGPMPAASGSATVELFKFDPALGTLTKVTLTLDADTSAGRIDWDNESLVVTDITLGIGAEVTATAPGALTLTAVPLQIASATGIAADNDGAADFIGTDSFSVVGGMGSDSDMGMLTAGLDPFIAGILDETFMTSIGSVTETFLSTTGGFGPIASFPGVTEGTVTVTYEFEAIPEPSTFVLAILGLLSLGFCGWRRPQHC